MVSPFVYPSHGSHTNSLSIYFTAITMSCVDSDGDGLLDFSIAIAYDSNAGANCAYDGTNGWPPPYPGTTAMCWFDDALRFTLPGE